MTEVYCLLGSVPEAVYNTLVAVDEEMRDLGREARFIVERFQVSGQQLWPRFPSSLCKEFLFRPLVGVLSFSARGRGFVPDMGCLAARMGCGRRVVVHWWDSTGAFRALLLRELLLIRSWPTVPCLTGRT